MSGALIDYDVATTTPDGVDLFADVYRPQPDRPGPTLLQRTPYGKSRTEHLDYSFDLLRAVRAGWNVVVQDVRGRGTSTGQFDPFRHEKDDGSHTLDWINAQEWSDGRIAMVGGSYNGATQWLAALSGHAGLLAFAPALTPDDYYDGWVYDGGAMRLGFLAHWIYESLWSELAQRRGLVVSGTQVRAEQASVLAPPGRTAFTPVGESAAPFHRTWREHPDRDDYWRELSPRDNLARVTAPAFVIAGWFDVFAAGAIESFVMLRERGASEHVRRMSRLVVGPWTHGQFAGTYADLDFGPGASAQAIDLTGRQLRWFDHVVKGQADAAETDPAVRVFVMGADEWRTFETWPPAEARPVTFALWNDPSALRIDREPTASGRVVADHPSDPVPTVGGATFLHGRHLALNAGPRDQAVLAHRDDVLHYRSNPIADQLSILGRVRVDLDVSCNRPDANLTVKLVIESPGGPDWAVLDGTLRLSHRAASDAPSSVEPGRVYPVSCALGHTAVLVPAGARLRLDIAAGNFPQVAAVEDPDDPGLRGPSMSRAVTVHTGGPHRSSLYLDVVPASAEHDVGEKAGACAQLS